MNRVLSGSKAFPVDMPIVDVSPNGEIKTAQNNPKSSPDQTVVAADVPKPAPDTTHADAHESPLFGAASKWKSVEIRPSATGDAVKDLDLLLAKLWEQNSVTPVAVASDEELLRRVYLDLAGRTPKTLPNEVRDYMQNTAADRYETLVDRLLNSPDHASHTGCEVSVVPHS